MVDLHAHLPQVPNAGLGFCARPADVARPPDVPDRARLGRPGGRRAARPVDLRGVRRRRHDDGAGLRRRVRGRHGRRVPGGRGSRHPGHPRQGDDGSPDVRPDDRSVHDPRPVAARVIRPDRPVARRRRRPPRLRGDAALRGVVHRRHAPRVGRARPRPPGRGGRATSPRTRSRSRRSVCLFPEAIDYVDVYDRAGALGERTVLAHAIHLSRRELLRLVESGAHVAHCPASNLFLGAGVMPLARWLEAGLSVGLGTDVAGGPDTSVFSVMRSGAYAQMARRTLAGGRGHGARPARLAAAGHARRRAGARSRGVDRLAGGREGGRRHRHRPRLCGGLAGHR